MNILTWLFVAWLMLCCIVAAMVNNGYGADEVVKKYRHWLWCRRKNENDNSTKGHGSNIQDKA